MEKSDFVKLINDNAALRAKNIRKGTSGVLVSYISATDDWIVMFLDDYNHGAYAVTKVKTVDLAFSAKMPPDWVEKWNRQIASENFYAHSELKAPKFKEYDRVRLMCDKPAYTEAGVKMGMEGCILFDYAVRGRWGVIFSEKGTGRDIATIQVHEDDLEFVE